MKHCDQTCYLHTPDKYWRSTRNNKFAESTASSVYDEIPPFSKEVQCFEMTDSSYPKDNVYEWNISRGVKETAIKPICTQGQKSEISNYTPIGLLSNIAKIFEKLFLME